MLRFIRGIHLASLIAFVACGLSYVAVALPTYGQQIAGTPNGTLVGGGTAQVPPRFTEPEALADTEPEALADNNAQNNDIYGSASASGSVWSTAPSEREWMELAPVTVEDPTLEGVELLELIDPRALKTIDGTEVGVCVGQEYVPRTRRFVDYRQHEGIISYMPGDGDQFGWIDFESSPYIHGGKRSGWTIGLGLHLLSGPNSVPLPSRLWDFSFGYQKRDTLSDVFSYDMAANVGVYSDFEDSARDGVRFLGHAVGTFHMNEAWDWVGGVDYLDRDDYKILPVMGFSWHSQELPNLNVELIFPRPRIEYALSGSERLYIGGQLGGGTWDIEMPGEVNDVMTYRDFRLLFGHEEIDEDGDLRGFELGYVFGRQVGLRNAPGAEFEFDDAFVIRFVERR